MSLRWRHYERDDVSNHEPHDCLLNRLFRRRSKKTSNSAASLAFEGGIHRWPVNSPHKEPVTRKMFPFDDAIMAIIRLLWLTIYNLHSAYRHGNSVTSVFITSSSMARRIGLIHNTVYPTQYTQYCGYMVLYMCYLHRYTHIAQANHDTADKDPL